MKNIFDAVLLHLVIKTRFEVTTQVLAKAFKAGLYKSIKPGIYKKKKQCSKMAAISNSVSIPIFNNKHLHSGCSAVG